MSVNSPVTVNGKSPTSENSETPTGFAKFKGGLSSLFNRTAKKVSNNKIINQFRENKYEILFGAIISATAKAAVLSCTASFMTPAVGVLAAAGAAGAVSAMGRHYFKYWDATHWHKDAEKAAALKLTLTKKEFAKKAAIGAGFGALGGALGYLGTSVLHNSSCFGILSKFKDMFVTSHPGHVVAGAAAVTKLAASGHTSGVVNLAAPTAPAPTASLPAASAPAVVAPVAAGAVVAAPVAVAPTPVIEVPSVKSPLDTIKHYAETNNVSKRLQDALERAQSSNPSIAAQGMDDVAIYAPKGFQAEAYSLLKQAAAAGNIKAQTDLIQMEFSGNKALGIKAAPEAALVKLEALAKHSKIADKLLTKLVDQHTDFTPAPVTAPAPTSALQSIEVKPGVKIPTVIADTPVATPAVPTPAPVAVAAPVATTPAPAIVTSVSATNAHAIAASATAATSGPDCQAIVDIVKTQEIRFVCKIDGSNESLLQLGDNVIINKPALLPILAR